MKSFCLLILSQLFSATLFAQQVPIQGLHLQRTNLVVRWKASKHPWPTNLWTYQVVPTKYPPEAISYLISLGPFTEEEKRYSGKDGVLFEAPSILPNLGIDFDAGQIDYNSAREIITTNRVILPTTNEVFALTTNLLTKFGINLSDLIHDNNGRPILHITAHEHVITFPFMTNGPVYTNVSGYGVEFERDIDGVEFWGGDGGRGRIDFGTNGIITGIWVHWRNLKHDKLYSAATMEKIIQWIHEGKATCTQVSGGKTIDWSTVKKPDH